MEPSQQDIKGLKDLPESCVSKILSFTTPRDACRLAAVSTLFRSAAHLWISWLPHHYNQILSEAVSPIEYSSMKDLYFRLCLPVMLQGRTKMFWLDRSSAKICYMLSPKAKELKFICGDVGRHWIWSPFNRCDITTCTRFEEAAKLDMEFYIQVWGKFDCKLLSPNTEYVLSFLINYDDCFERWKRATLKLFLTPPEGEKMELFRVPADLKRASQDPKLRSASLKCEHDGWMEIVAGEFTTKSYSDRDEPKILRFGMEQLSCWWNRRFLFGGVKIQPKSS